MRRHSGRGAAVVIGAGMAGLVAARALCDAFEQVIIVERDAVRSASEPRRGVPQGRHIHGLLAGGRGALEAMFPGFTEEIASAGAIRGDVTLDARWCFEAAEHPRFRSGMVGLGMTRPFLEGFVRRKTLALSNVRLFDGAAAEGLEASPDRARVTGVRLLSNEVVPADLVVDASGRGSRAPAWLAALGYPRPVEERIDVGVGYATRFYARRPDEQLAHGGTGLFVSATPDLPRAGTLLAQEGNRWIVTLIGYGGDAAPATVQGFLEFAASLPSGDIATLVSTAEPLGDFATTRFPSNQRRHFERVGRAPDGFVVFGDALCSFNPAYGQGMSVAALEADVLHRVVSTGAHDVARRFYRAASRIVAGPWSIAVGNDLRMPGIVGPRTPMVRVLNWYVARLARTAHHDTGVALAFHRVLNLLDPPPGLLAPRVAARVLGRGA